MNREFHRAVYAASYNDVIIKLPDDLWDKSDHHRRIEESAVLAGSLQGYRLDIFGRCTGSRPLLDGYGCEFREFVEGFQSRGPRVEQVVERCCEVSRVDVKRSGHTLGSRQVRTTARPADPVGRSGLSRA
ncbi:hypothetical protein SAMN05444745_1425 [Arthrobacter sp. OV608]|nr:hypothetical protein SAMN05444745_1425 [Arthrobacter sp. OV608]